MHTSNPEQGHVQKFTRGQMLDFSRAAPRVVDWRNSFVILSVFYCRSKAQRSSASTTGSRTTCRPPARAAGIICCRHSTATDPPDLAA
jgi:hypothetical protein